MISAFIFSLMGAGVSSVADVFPATQCMWSRSIIQGSVAFSYLVYHGEYLLGAPEARKLVLLRGALGALNNWIFFFAITQIPLGDANAILFTGPIFTALYSCFFMGDRFSVMEVVATVLSITGVVLVARPPLLFGAGAAAARSSASITAGAMSRQGTVALCMLGAASNGAIPVIISGIPKGKAHWMSLLLSFALFGVTMSSIALLTGLQVARWPSIEKAGIRPWAGLLAIGLAATLAQSFWNMGCQRERPQVAAITRQLDVPLSFVWQVALFRESPMLASLFGAGMVLMSTSTVLGQKLFCATSKPDQGARELPSKAPPAEEEEVSDQEKV